MDDKAFLQFITNLAFNEIIPAIPYQIDLPVAENFANNVLDRFRNPHIRHEWLSISLQYSTKIKMRVIPLLLNYFKTYNTVPQNMALGFAAFIRFMKVEQQADGTFTGSISEKSYKVTDSQAAWVSKVWQTGDINSVVEVVLKNKELWDADLSVLPNFKDTVSSILDKIMKNGVTPNMVAPMNNII
jgi:tagaturonate reductase